jgi:hypothetical protein
MVNGRNMCWSAAWTIRKNTTGQRAMMLRCKVLQVQAAAGAAPCSIAKAFYHIISMFYSGRAHSRH